MKKVIVLITVAAAISLVCVSCASRSIGFSKGEAVPQLEASKTDTGGLASEEAEPEAAPPDQGMMDESAEVPPEYEAAKKSLPESALEPSKGLALMIPESPPSEKLTGKDEAEPEKTQEAQTGPTVKYLSADDSNSMASPVVVRKMVKAGRYVQPSLVRTYEFLNYYHFDYPPPKDGFISIIPEMRKLDGEGEYSLQVAVRSADRAFSALPAMNITFAVDVSGSMAGDSIDYAKKFIRAFVARMRPGDRISIVSFARDAHLLLDSHVKGEATASLLEKEIFPLLKPSDVTDLEKGIALAYEIAQKNYNYQYLNRVILLSDGGANAGTQTVSVIARHAEDSDRQGIYLAGIGVGEGFNDSLMDAVTDKGRGAYIFIDSEAEIYRSLADEAFVKNFDLALKNVRLKMTMPAGWEMTEFHGEQVSSKASDVTPQYLSPNSQMIYHLTVRRASGGTENQDEEAVTLKSVFSFEAEYTPIGKQPQKASVDASVEEMLKHTGAIAKGDAVTAFAEMLKKIAYPLADNREKNLAAFEEGKRRFDSAQPDENDQEIREIRSLLEAYRVIIEKGEQFPSARDTYDRNPDAVLGIDVSTVLKVSVDGMNPRAAVKGLSSLGESTRLLPLEGYAFLVMSTGPVWNSQPAGTGSLGSTMFDDPQPEYSGSRRITEETADVFDLHTVSLRLRAPLSARSFSFDFNFFSAEYPEYVNQNFNDTFYAVLEAQSTNRGRRTNIAFDSNGNSIEVDNNYFQKEFHPIPNTGTGFDQNGSTGWLRCSWPIRGGEEFTLTFSIHDEGDSIYDSLVLIDNFRWNGFEAVGTTDPLN